MSGYIPPLRRSVAAPWRLLPARQYLIGSLIKWTISTAVILVVLFLVGICCIGAIIIA